MSDDDWETDPDYVNDVTEVHEPVARLRHSQQPCRLSHITVCSLCTAQLNKLNGALFVDGYTAVL